MSKIVFATILCLAICSCIAQTEEEYEKSKIEKHRKKVQLLKNQAPKGFKLSSYSITDIGDFIPFYTEKTSDTSQTNNVQAEAYLKNMRFNEEE